MMIEMDHPFSTYFALEIFILMLRAKLLYNSKHIFVRLKRFLRIISSPCKTAMLKKIV